jgi:hypothetical protein
VFLHASSHDRRTDPLSALLVGNFVPVRRRLRGQWRARLGRLAEHTEDPDERRRRRVTTRGVAVDR